MFAIVWPADAIRIDQVRNAGFLQRIADGVAAAARAGNGFDIAERLFPANRLQSQSRARWKISS